VLNVAPIKATAGVHRAGGRRERWRHVDPRPAGIATRHEVEMSVAKDQTITFEMLESAVWAIYELPISDARASRS
jgi:hypothetical protein